MGLISRMVNKRIAAYQRDFAQTHYREVEHMYRQMRGWRHDYRNHIQVLRSYAQAGKLQAICDYLNELEGDLERVDIGVKTGNAVADAILSSKVAMAKAQQIDVRLDADIPLALRTSEVDLCIILGNLFDNAIEASLALPAEQRMIRVYMDMKNTQLYISMINRTAAGKREKLDGRFRSTKGTGHGLGLIRVDDVVKRNGGYLSRNSEEGAFSTEILLPQQ